MQLFDGDLDKIPLQKLLFMFTKRQQKSDCDFIPYKYGCYSLGAYTDLVTIVNKRQLLSTETNYIRTDKVDY